MIYESLRPDLTVERPTKFIFIINLKAAKIIERGEDARDFITIRSGHSQRGGHREYPI